MKYYDEYDDQEWVMAQGETDYVLPIFKMPDKKYGDMMSHEKYGDMMVISATTEAVYVTKEQAMKFFNLVEAP